MFSERAYLRVIKSRDYVVKILTGQQNSALDQIESISKRKDKCILKINPFPNKPWFLHVYGTSLLKTLWEKEKMLVTSIFSFSHSVSNSIKEINNHFTSIQFVVCKCFKFGHVQNSVVWERVKLLLRRTEKFVKKGEDAGYVEKELDI